MISRKSPRRPRLNGKWYFSLHSLVVVVVVVVVNYCLSGIQLLNQVYSGIKCILFIPRSHFKSKMSKIYWIRREDNIENRTC